MSTRRNLTVIVLSIATLAGCSSAGDAVTATAAPSDGAQAVTVETAKPGGTRAMAVQFKGPLNADLEGDKVCLWVTGESLVWPTGSTVRVAPVRVLDSAGNIIATEGQALIQGEGLLIDDQQGCHPGTRRWLLTSVQSPAKP